MPGLQFTASTLREGFAACVPSFSDLGHMWIVDLNRRSSMQETDQECGHNHRLQKGSMGTRINSVKTQNVDLIA